MGQVSRKLKKYILGIALGIALMCGKESYAQYNREYFFWVEIGRASCRERV